MHDSVSLAGLGRQGTDIDSLRIFWFRATIVLPPSATMMSIDPRTRSIRCSFCFCTFIAFVDDKHAHGIFIGGKSVAVKWKFRIVSEFFIVSARTASCFVTGNASHLAIFMVLLNSA